MPGFFIIVSEVSKINFNNFIKCIFFTDKGYFNWVAITSIIAILTLIWTILFNSKKYKADLIANGRKEWINSSRPLVAEFLTEVSKYMFDYQTFRINFAYEPNSLNSEELAKLKIEYEKQKQAKIECLSEKMKQIRNLYYQLTLAGVINNRSNLSKKLCLLWHELDYIGQYYTYGISHGKFSVPLRSNYDKVIDEYISNLINEISIEGRNYFAYQWGKVKKGK